MAENYERNGGDTPQISLPQIPTNYGPLLKWAGVILGVVLLFALISFGRGVYTDMLWFDALGFKGVYTKVLLTRITLFFAGVIIFAIPAGLSFWLGHRYTDGETNLPIPPELVEVLRKAVKWGAVVAVIVLSLIFGSILASHWELFLRFTNSVSFAVKDPVYGRNVGFFVFDLPMLSFFQGWLLGVIIVSLLGTAALQFINFNLRGLKFQLTTPVKVQLSVLGAIIMFMVAWGHWIDRWELVLSDDGAVFGAAYTDLNARKPALMILTIVASAAGVLMLVNAYFKGLRLLVGAVALWLVLAVLLGAAWPALMQQFTVTPNEFAREQEFIQRNIDFTRTAFNLEGISEDFYPAESDVTPDLIQNNLKTINNIRLWDSRPLSSVYRQIQIIRTYYDFRNADVDRYRLGGEYRQVLLSAREVAPERLEIESQTWVNRKLFYTHGIGVAMSPATEFTLEGRPEFFAQDIPADGVVPISLHGQEGEPDLTVDNPRIYYGENTLEFVIANTKTAELDYQTTDELIYTNYSGTGGVRLSSFWRKLAYTWQLGDINILISGEITSDSLLQYRRTIRERITTVAPFLVLDADPYIVATDDRLVWMQDAYTTSDQYPYSDPTGDPLVHEFNYMRNSVKITLDAYDGTLKFYIWDPTDPVVQTYSKIFPDLFEPADAMPQALQDHVRYPEDFFTIQAEKYIKYHMKEPQNFYNNEDLWATPNEKFGQTEELRPIEPYYVIMKLPGQETEEFVLLFPYTPSQRQNLIGWLAARSDGEHYGKIQAFNFPKGLNVDGPEQVEARIDNDQDISEWFTLRCTAGSICIRGNLLVIPIGESVLYVEPVYIQAEGVEFPELKRVILATADKVVMEDSLALALTALTGDPSFAAAKAAGEAVSSTPTTPVAPSQPRPEPVDSIQGQIGVVGDAIEGIKIDLELLEEALKRLEELTGGE